jgi:hypothetical protein
MHARKFFPHAFGNDNFSRGAMRLCGERLGAGNRVIARRRARLDGRDKPCHGESGK